MSEYTVGFRSSAERALRRLDKTARNRIADAIDALASNPRPAGVVKMKGKEGRYRVRVGDYRVVFAIDDIGMHVEIMAVGHRREIYRR